MIHLNRIKRLLTMSEEEWQMIQLVFRMTLRQYTLFERICDMDTTEVDELMLLTGHTLDYPEDPDEQKERLQQEFRLLCKVANRKGMSLCSNSRLSYLQLYEERFKKLRKQHRELLKSIVNGDTKETISKILSNMYFNEQNQK